LLNYDITLAGCKTNHGSVKKFAEYFQSIYYQSAEDVYAVTSFANERLLCNANSIRMKQADQLCLQINVESILKAKCIQYLCPNKACGPDNLSAEHLQYAHPSLTIHLKLLFNAIFTHSFVPDKFGLGIIIPLLKDKTGNVTDVHNYRPITLTPIFSKVFENLILQLCQDYFLTDELQCGFKQGLGCIDIIFAVKTTVNYFVERGSCVMLLLLTYLRLSIE
jgi:hypothetical protein